MTQGPVRFSHGAGQLCLIRRFSSTFPLFSPADFYRNQVVCLPQTMSLWYLPEPWWVPCVSWRLVVSSQGSLFPLSISEKQTRIRNRSLRLTDLCVWVRGCHERRLVGTKGAAGVLHPVGPSVGMKDTQGCCDLSPHGAPSQQPSRSAGRVQARARTQGVCCAPLSPCRQRPATTWLRRSSSWSRPLATSSTMTRLWVTGSK